jgi:hypothetical protein
LTSTIIFLYNLSAHTKIERVNTEMKKYSIGIDLGTTNSCISTCWPNGQPRRCLDVTRARERFGFVAPTSFEEGLRRTVQWYLEHREEADSRTPGF